MWKTVLWYVLAVGIYAKSIQKSGFMHVDKYPYFV
jgi:hypothetical protein